MSRCTPETPEEAAQVEYGTPYRPIGYNATRCVERVHDGGRWPSFHQCQRKPGHGPGGLYCRQHGAKAASRLDRRR